MSKHLHLDSLPNEEKQKITELLLKEKKGDNKLPWIYNQPKANNEDFLLGKAVKDIKEVNEINIAPDEDTPSQRLARLDMQAKFREDPLNLMRQHEIDKRRELLQNTAKMKKLQHLLAKQKERQEMRDQYGEKRSAKKSKKRKHKHSGKRSEKKNRSKTKKKKHKHSESNGSGSDASSDSSLSSDSDDDLLNTFAKLVQQQSAIAADAPAATEDQPKVASTTEANQVNLVLAEEVPTVHEHSQPNCGAGHAKHTRGKHYRNDRGAVSNPHQAQQRDYHWQSRDREREDGRGKRTDNHDANDDSHGYRNPERFGAARSSRYHAASSASGTRDSDTTANRGYSRYGMAQKAAGQPALRSRAELDRLRDQMMADAVARDAERENRVARHTEMVALEAAAEATARQNRGAGFLAEMKLAHAERSTIEDGVQRKASSRQRRFNGAIEGNESFVRR